MLKIIPFYTGKKTLSHALKDKKSRDMLWLEILFNDEVDWEKEMAHDENVKTAYRKACAWYGKFKTIMDAVVKRKPLSPQKGTIEEKEYRKFMEVVNFVSS